MKIPSKAIEDSLRAQVKLTLMVLKIPITDETVDLFMGVIKFAFGEGYIWACEHPEE